MAPVPAAKDCCIAPVQPRVAPQRLNYEAVRSHDTQVSLVPGELEPIDTVNVTGTYFRGATPIGSDVISVGRQEIANSGALTAGQFLQTLSVTTRRTPTPTDG